MERGRARRRPNQMVVWWEPAIKNLTAMQTLQDSGMMQHKGGCPKQIRPVRVAPYASQLRELAPAECSLALITIIQARRVAVVAVLLPCETKNTGSVKGYSNR